MRKSARDKEIILSCYQNIKLKSFFQENNINLSGQTVDIYRLTSKREKFDLDEVLDDCYSNSEDFGEIGTVWQNKQNEENSNDYSNKYLKGQKCLHFIKDKKDLEVVLDNTPTEKIGYLTFTVPVELAEYFTQKKPSVYYKNIFSADENIVPTEEYAEIIEEGEEYEDEDVKLIKDIVLPSKFLTVSMYNDLVEFNEEYYENSDGEHNLRFKDESDYVRNYMKNMKDLYGDMIDD